MEKIMKSWMKIAGVSVLTLMMAACNTIEGVGQDVESAGDEIEETANENK